MYIEQKRFTRIGGYWNRKGENEIDLIAVNEFDKTAIIAEIKRNADNINMEKLKETAAQFCKKTGSLKEYNIEYKALSMKNIL